MVARELDQMLEKKVQERERQEEVAKRIKEIEGVKVRGKEMEEELQSMYMKKEILSANGCILLYRSMLQMTQKLALFEMGDLVLEDIPKNQNFLVLHRLLRRHAKLEEVDEATIGYLASFPSNPNVLYDLETIKLSDFDTVTTGTDHYWCTLVDKLEAWFKRN